MFRFSDEGVHSAAGEGLTICSGKWDYVSSLELGCKSKWTSTGMREVGGVLLGDDELGSLKKLDGPIGRNKCLVRD